MQNHIDDFAKSDLDRLEKLADNFKWFNSHYNSLKKNYENRYVAIQERQILERYKSRKIGKKTRYKKL